MCFKLLWSYFVNKKNTRRKTIKFAFSSIWFRSTFLFPKTVTAATLTTATNQPGLEPVTPHVKCVQFFWGGTLEKNAVATPVPVLITLDFTVKPSTNGQIILLYIWLWFGAGVTMGWIGQEGMKGGGGRGWDEIHVLFLFPKWRAAFWAKDGRLVWILFNIKSRWVQQSELYWVNMTNSQNTRLIRVGVAVRVREPGQKNNECLSETISSLQVSKSIKFN